MDVLWERKSATVSEVAEGLEGPPLAYSTVLTMLRILEDKGYLRHTKEGKAFVYHPVVERREASRKAIWQVLRQFFGNSPELLVVNLLENDELSPKELKRLKQMIEESEA
jgi:predicted transcriptional regulator